MRPARPRCFVGRERDVAALKRFILGPDNTSPSDLSIAIHGIGGVGKSSLLAHLAYDADVTAKFDVILWTSLGQHPNVTARLSEWAVALDIDLPKSLQGSDTPHHALGATLRNALADKRSLLLVDDIWDQFYSNAFRVGGESSVSVYTTRRTDVATWLAPGTDFRYPLGGLEPPDALALLRQYAEEAVDRHPAASENLIAALDHLPLAVVVAGHLLAKQAQYRKDVGELLRQLQDDASQLLGEQVPPDMADLVAESSPTVAALLRKSLALLDEETRRRFAWLGSMAPKPATFDVVRCAYLWDVGDKEANATLQRLMDHGLVEACGRGRYRMHALLLTLSKSLWREEDRVEPE